jgi:tRNA(Arg) A34 adenosine deaminase TadA
MRAEAANPRPAFDRAEVDHLFSLLAYAVVYKDWQSRSRQPLRGHNIGAVLVDSRLRPVFWARNANIAGNSTSQHAEVRLIHNFLECSARPDIHGYTIYTTLEPCAMCTGMMSLTRVTRTVYGQEDPFFGNALERLAADHTESGGDPPYPRLFRIDRSPSPFAAQLDEAFGRSGDSNIVRWLLSDEAREIYAAAYSELATMDGARLGSDVSRAVLDRTRGFLEQVSSTYIADPAGLCKAGSQAGHR